MDSKILTEKLKNGYVKLRLQVQPDAQEAIVATLNPDLMGEQLSVSSRGMGSDFSKSLRRPYRYLDVWNSTKGCWSLIRWNNIVAVDGKKLKNGVQYIS